MPVLVGRRCYFIKKGKNMVCIIDEHGTAWFLRVLIVRSAFQGILDDTARRVGNPLFAVCSKRKCETLCQTYNHDFLGFIQFVNTYTYTYLYYTCATPITFTTPRDGINFDSSLTVKLRTFHSYFRISRDRLVL